jgi:hypothetical protein
MNREERRAIKRIERGHAKPLVIRRHWKKLDPIAHAIEGACITDNAQLDKLLMRELSAIDAFTRGKAGLQEFRDLVEANNITQTLVSMDIGPEAQQAAHDAEQALIETARRFERTGKMGLSGPGIQAVREVIEWHHAQRSSIARSVYSEAIRRTSARVKNKHDVIDLGELRENDENAQGRTEMGWPGVGSSV